MLKKAVRRSWFPLASALLAGAFVFGSAGDSFAAERCTTKPAVCARLKAVAKARGTATPTAAAVARAERPSATAPIAARCTTKPVVCARLSGSKSSPNATPLTLATSSSEGARCTTKPAVCARLKMQPGRQPVTLANAE